MKTTHFLVICFMTFISSAVQAGSVSQHSCPPGYALHIDAPPPPKDGQAPEALQSKTAAEKEEDQMRQNAEELGRMHCIPLSEISKNN